LPVLTVELAAEELLGVDALRAFGAQVYGERDAAGILHQGQPLKITRRGGRTTLAIELPFADRDDLELGRRGDELLVRVGPYRRAIALPDSLRTRPVADASLKQGRLRVTFEGSEADG
jgi:arsenite-transporting ATPase